MKRLEARQAIGEARIQGVRPGRFQWWRAYTRSCAGGVVTELFQGGGADFPAWHADHAQEGVVVVRVHDQPKVGHQAFDFLASGKAVAARQAIRHLVMLQLQLNQRLASAAATGSQSRCRGRSVRKRRLRIYRPRVRLRRLRCGSGSLSGSRRHGPSAPQLFSNLVGLLEISTLAQRRMRLVER